MLLRLEARSAMPAFRQICARIVALVEEGTLRPGHRLPPTRELARQLALHRSTVVRAYEELRALGYLESRSGGYTTIRARPRQLAKHAGAIAGSLVDWRRAATRQAVDAHDRIVRGRARSRSDGVIDFERLAADPALAPADDLRRCFRSVLATGGPALFDYAERAGAPPLRAAIARRLRAHGVAVSAEEVLVTCGAQQGLDLALRMLARAGDSVVVEAPTYDVAHALLRLHGVRPIEIPMREDGMDLDALAGALVRAKPKLLYTIPTFHNPTGITTTQAHRERLLAICERARVPIVEDGFEEEMKYFGKGVLPIKSMDARGLVLYVSAFSKVVFPGARVGWIAAPPEAIAPLTSLQYAACLAVSSVTQAAVARFAGGRALESHLRRVHRVYRQRMQIFLRGLDEHLPRSVAWTRPAGGYTTWLTLPRPPGKEAQLVDRLLDAGVSAAPGSPFFATRPRKLHLRLSIACVDAEEIAEGCRRLGEVVTRFLRG